MLDRVAWILRIKYDHSDSLIASYYILDGMQYIPFQPFISVIHTSRDIGSSIIARI